MFSICTAYIEEGKLEETLLEYKESEKKFTKEIGVLFRKFFQCEFQPHIIWSITEWDKENSHHDAAQSIIKIRRDDRIASIPIPFRPEPYFEIFCDEEKSLSVGNFSEDLNYIIVIHGLIGEKVKDTYLDLRKKRLEEFKGRLQWFNVFHNIYNSYEFVAFVGFKNEDDYKKIQYIGELFFEEYIFTGLRNPLGMSYIAAYNQFICKSINF